MQMNYFFQQLHSFLLLSNNHFLQLLDNQGQIIQSTPFAVDFIMERDPLPPIEMDTGVFMLAVPYPNRSLVLEIERNSETLLEIDLTTTLLHFAIDAIPQAGFVNEPDLKRSALHDEADQIESSIKVGNLFEAVDKLEHSFKPKIIDWLIDNYQTTNVFEYSKQQVLDLVDAIIIKLIPKLYLPLIARE